jgi:hypothetical protein
LHQAGGRNATRLLFLTAVLAFCRNNGAAIDPMLAFAFDLD